MVGSVLLLLICIIWGLIYLFSSLVRRSKELARTRAYEAERRAYEAKLKSKEYIAEQEERRKKELEGVITTMQTTLMKHLENIMK